MKKTEGWGAGGDLLVGGGEGVCFEFEGECGRFDGGIKTSPSSEAVRRATNEVVGKGMTEVMRSSLESEPLR